jgi:hypothetical protein
MNDNDNRWRTGEYEFAEAIMNTDPVGRRQALEDLGMWDPDIEREWGYADEDIAGEDNAYDELLGRYSGRSRRGGSRSTGGSELLSLAVGLAIVAGLSVPVCLAVAMVVGMP